MKIIDSQRAGVIEQDPYAAFYFRVIVRSPEETELGKQLVKRDAMSFLKEHNGFPVLITLPCGNHIDILDLKEILDLPNQDIPCPCGNPNHWLIKYEVIVRGEYEVH